jgi:hypothetical protein
MRGETGSSTPPDIRAFVAGEFALEKTLAWAVEDGGEGCAIDNGVGMVGPIGMTTVAGAPGTVYTLTCGAVSATATLP